LRCLGVIARGDFGLILRSGPKDRVSKDGAALSFETALPRLLRMRAGEA
jgi:hypothetical protein